MQALADQIREPDGIKVYGRVIGVMWSPGRPAGADAYRRARLSDALHRDASSLHRFLWPSETEK